MEVQVTVVVGAGGVLSWLACVCVVITAAAMYYHCHPSTLCWRETVSTQAAPAAALPAKPRLSQHKQTGQHTIRTCVCLCGWEAVVVSKLVRSPPPPPPPNDRLLCWSNDWNWKSMIGGLPAPLFAVVCAPQPVSQSVPGRCAPLICTQLPAGGLCSLST